jgi:hypothetical protein
VDPDPQHCQQLSTQFHCKDEKYNSLSFSLLGMPRGVLKMFTASTIFCSVLRLLPVRREHSPAHSQKHKVFYTERMDPFSLQSFIRICTTVFFLSFLHLNSACTFTSVFKPVSCKCANVSQNHALALRMAVADDPGKQCCGSGMFIPDPTFFHPGF